MLCHSPFVIPSLGFLHAGPKHFLWFCTFIADCCSAIKNYHSLLLYLNCVHNSPVPAAGKRIRTESGRYIDGSQARKGMYQEWAKANKQRIASSGGAEDAQYAKDLANRFKPSMRFKSFKTTGNSDAAQRGGELKTKDQVRQDTVGCSIVGRSGCRKHALAV